MQWRTLHPVVDSAGCKVRYRNDTMQPWTSQQVGAVWRTTTCIFLCVVGWTFFALEQTLLKRMAHWQGPERMSHVLLDWKIRIAELQRLMVWVHDYSGGSKCNGCTCRCTSAKRPASLNNTQPSLLITNTAQWCRRCFRWLLCDERQSERLYSDRR